MVEIGALEQRFQSYVYSQTFDIIGVTETWLSTNIFTNEIFPSCYTVLRKDRDSRGGGVLLAFKSFLTVMQLSSPNDLKIVSAEIDPNLLVCLIYRPPNCSDQYNTSLMAYLTHGIPHSWHTSIHSIVLKTLYYWEI